MKRSMKMQLKPKNAAFRFLLSQCLLLSIAWFLVAFLKIELCLTYIDSQRTYAENFQQHTQNQFSWSNHFSQSNIVTSNNNDSPCMAEYNRVSVDRVVGLTADDFERSRAVVGNRQRLASVTRKLIAQHKPIHVVVCGGSISLGHGVSPSDARYSDRLHQWLLKYYPVTKEGVTTKDHVVTNMAAHGADMCAMAKRMNLLHLETPPDLFILEFAVNDYEGQDFKVHIDHKTDVFFEGFLDLASCAEVVVYKLPSDYPDAAILFLEFQTAILNRKTAQLLHTGVAQHYQIPVISYADALFPDFYRLLEKLRHTRYSIPPGAIDKSILPYPHGCSPCRPENIVKSFRDKGCKSLCVFAKRSGFYNNGECDEDGHDPCFVPFFSHDAVHPSAVGHHIARDLIVHALLSTYAAACENQQFFAEYLLPQHSGWLAAGPNYHDELRRKSDFVMVNDTMRFFGQQYPLLSKEHSNGFVLTGDQLADRKGWIATNPTGGEVINFEIDLPQGECYIVYLSVLRSYETVGTFTVQVHDLVKDTSTFPRTLDCIWKPKISIPADIQLTRDDMNECSGKCKIVVTTNAEVAGRGGNTIKIVSLSVRKCIPHNM